MDNVDVRMVRLDLTGIPDTEVPEPYHFRWYQSGDETAWADIQSAADEYNTITPELFREQFGNDDSIIAERQAYLCTKDGSPIGTATAWFDDDRGGLPWGRVHWVAVTPEHQGQGLAKPLLSVTLRRMRGLGHNRCYLTTSTARIPAINLYLQFGFSPEIRTEPERRAWRAVAEALPHPALQAI